jgi:hypothetical protein
MDLPGKALQKFINHHTGGSFSAQWTNWTKGPSAFALDQQNVQALDSQAL